MKSKRRESKCAKCPFYDSEEAQKVICEGVIENTKIHICFDTPDALKQYKKIFCYNDYQNCIIHKALSVKYEDE